MTGLVNEEAIYALLGGMLYIMRALYLVAGAVGLVSGAIVAHAIITRRRKKAKR